MSCWKLRVANTDAARRLRGSQAGILERDFERSFAYSRIVDCGITKEKEKSMNFGVIGPGNIGEVIIRKLGDAGYPVKMANSTSPESLKRPRSENGGDTVSVEQVGQDVDMLFIVVPQKRFQNYRKGF